VSGKWASGQLYEVVKPRSGRPASDPRWAGEGISEIVYLRTATHHQHVATIHRVRMPDGTAPHCHPKHYTRRDCSRIWTNEHADDAC